MNRQALSVASDRPTAITRHYSLASSSIANAEEIIISKAITEEDMALLKEASEIFNETGCVPGIDGEQVPTERIVPDAKAYISETIDDPEIRRLGYVWIYGRLDFKRFVFGRAGGRVLINAGIGRMSALEAMHPGAPSLQFVEYLA